MSLYRTILKRAWDNAWTHKYLWFFGLFAALLGNGGELELIFRNFSSDGQGAFLPAWQKFVATGIFSRNSLINISNLAHNEPFSLFVAVSTLLFIAFLVLFIVWLTIVSQVAVVHNTAKIKHDMEHDFKDGVMHGIKKFWPVFGLNIIIKIIAGVLFFLIGLPIYFGLVKSALMINLTYILLFVVFIPISLVLSFVIKYAIVYSVVKGQKFLEAIKSGWIMFQKNWLISMEMAILLFFINFMTGIVIIMIFLILAVPLLFVVLIFSKLLAFVNVWFFILSALILLIVMVVFVGSLLSTFQISAWTHLFMELVGKGGVSKLVRVFGKGK